MFEYILRNIPNFFFLPMRTHRFWLMAHGRGTKMNRKPIISFGDETYGRIRLPVPPFYVLKRNNELSVTL